MLFESQKYYYIGCKLVNSISPQVWIRVENNRLETLHKVMCGQMPQIFNLLEGNAVPQKKKNKKKKFLGAKKETSVV